MTDQPELADELRPTDAHWLETNRANWDERVEGHLTGYDTDGFVADPARISTVVRDDLALMAPHLPNGSVDGLTLLHLQCHIGTDTLSFARRGARVTGVEFSSEAIGAARGLAARAGLEATFVQSTVDEASAHVDGKFDVVYTSIGALCWLGDLTAWARTIRAVLKPGGLFYVRDTHPMLGTIDDDATPESLRVRYPYFANREPLRFDGEYSYAGAAKLANTANYEWFHPLSEIMGVLLAEGLVIEAFGEQDVLPWKAFPWMVEAGPGGAFDGNWVLPDGRERMPMTFSLAARG